METCFRCGRSSEEVRLFEGVYSNEIVVSCERCSLIEGIPIIKIPSTDQLRNSEKGVHVYQRMKRLAGFGAANNPEKSVSEELKELEEHPELEVPEEAPVKLVDNFHWIIQHERRLKGLTQRQLADNIGESEKAIQLIERNNLPENSLPVLKKLEQFFRIVLVRESPKEERRKPYELRAAGRAEINLSAPIGVPEKLVPPESVDFKTESSRRIRISDLRAMQNMIEKDFPTKSSLEIGKEQLDEFGKQKPKSKPVFFPSSKPRPQRSADGYKGPFGIKNEQGKTPTISELMERRKSKEIEEEGKITGDGIEIIEEDK